MNQQNIYQLYPKIQSQLKPLLLNVYRNEKIQTYHSIVQQIKSKFPLPTQMPQITYPNQDSLNQFFLQNYSPLIVDLSTLSQKPNVKIKLFKNAIYYGEIYQDMRQGIGILIKDNLQVYEGQFLLDKKDGIGFEILKPDTYYHGHYIQGFPNGEGVYHSSNHHYIGQWQHGKQSGIGLSEGIKNDYYLGNWENGKYFGFGLHVSDVIYIGDVINDLKHGYGEEYFAEGDYYKGQYKNGQPNGQGIYVWKSGHSYEGEFQNGLRWGTGFWQQKTDHGVSFYRGQYQNDKKNGQGHYRFSNGTEYVGHFVDDLREGYGEMVWPDKAVYKGHWQTGLMEGEGIYQYKQCNLQGVWKQNQFHYNERVRVSLNQFPITNQLKDIKEDEEITSKIAEEPDHEGIGNIFKKITLQSKTSLCASEVQKLPHLALIQKQFDALQEQQISQRTHQTYSVGIQTEINQSKKKVLTELPEILVKKKKVQSSYSVHNQRHISKSGYYESMTNTNSPKTRDSNSKQNYSQELKPKREKKSLLSKVEEKVLQLKIEKSKLSPYKFSKLWSQKVANEAKQLLYPPVWKPPSLHPYLVRRL